MIGSSHCRACERADALAGRPLLTPQQTAILLGRSKSWVEQKLATGLLPGVRDGSRWIVRRADLLRDGWIVDEERADGHPVGAEKPGAAP